MLKKINIIPCQAYGLHIFGKRNVFFLIISIISQIFIRKTFKIRVPWKNLYFRMTAIFVWPPSWKKVFFRMPPFLNFIRVGWRITMQSLLLLLKSAQFDYFVCLIRCTKRHLWNSHKHCNANGPDKHRRNFVYDDGDLSPALLKVVVTVTTTFQSGICNFSSSSKFHI